MPPHLMAAAEQSPDGIEFYQRLVDGNEQACRELLHRWRGVEGASVVRVCEAIAEAFHKIGDAWECAQLDVYREHIASQIGYRTLLEVGSQLAQPSPNAPRAIGCTPEHDPYRLPTCMVELVLKGLGWHAQSIGTSLPLELFMPAIDEVQPQLCWVSVSYVHSPNRLREQLALLGEAARARGIEVICGGRAIDDAAQHQLRGLKFLTNLSELETAAALS